MILIIITAMLCCIFFLLTPRNVSNTGDEVIDNLFNSGKDPFESGNYSPLEADRVPSVADSADLPVVKPAVRKNSLEEDGFELGKSVRDAREQIEEAVVLIREGKFDILGGILFSESNGDYGPVCPYGSFDNGIANVLFPFEPKYNSQKLETNLEKMLREAKSKSDKERIKQNKFAGLLPVIRKSLIDNGYIVLDKDNFLSPGCKQILNGEDCLECFCSIVKDVNAIGKFPPI